MPEFLLELRSEEIPARMQRRAAAQLKERLAALLTEAGFALAKDAVTTYAGPRRLTAVAADLPAAQPDRTVERKGPRVGSPQGAIDGFLKAAGLASLDQAEQRDSGKGVFYFAVQRQLGRATSAVLAEIVPALIKAFEWPKSMRWATWSQRWVRPLHAVLCVFDGETVVGKIDLGGGAMGFTNETIGHRFLAPEPFAVTSFSDYADKLDRAFVMVDAAERRAYISRIAGQRAGENGLQLRVDDGLLDEVTGLVEWPVPLLGRIDDAFMDLPVEVLTTSMRAHLKYFACLRLDDTLAPRFVVVSNMENEDGGKQVVAGNERVLRARLSDARFFWDQDRKRKLADRVADLGAVLFYQRLGTVAEKAERIAALAKWLAPTIPGCDPARAERAGHLAKADLTTGMVGEFPELQGVMGRYYARHDGEPEMVADAIAEHYAPKGPDDRCPTAPVSVAVALADKIDTLVGFFAIDEKPTGSKDPFALRRAALGAIRLIIENRLRLGLIALFERAHALYAGFDRAKADGVASALLDFLADRLKVHLKDQGLKHDLLAAVFAVPGGEDDLVRLIQRGEALKGFLASDDGANLLVAYRRAANILRIEEKKDGTRYDRLADPRLFATPEEARLHQAIADVAARTDPFLADEDFSGAMGALADLRQPVDDFFDRVTVNAEEADLRQNRLCLLSQIRVGMDAIADFSKIEG
ncbi:MAG: glycine--tRNA ligase subunit beta [Alphaproteobacteria bacterium]|nr:glycine--tRNA ligase subunit beta [Alphaproteobacteria bacterium]